ncbi:MAG: carboxymuconolactone decarboxylase family protein [Acidimicrobiales bacterium]
MAPRMAPARLEDLDPETAALVESAGGLNIFATLARHPKALKRWLVFGSHVLAKSTLPARERELLILRVGWRCGSEYEFGQHTVIGQERRDHRRGGPPPGERRPRRLVGLMTRCGSGRPTSSWPTTPSATGPGRSSPSG